MATLYEYYNAGDDTAWNVFAGTWRAQTFTPATAHKITSVKIRIYRQGSPGNITVSIRETDGSGHPTGGDLGDTGTTNGDTLTASSAGEWREITLGNYNLDASTKYAIVVRVLGGDGSNRIYWRIDETSPSYTDGNFESSTNSGSSWSTNSGYDCMFEDWGEVIAVAYTRSLSTSMGLLTSLSRLEGYQRPLSTAMAYFVLASKL